MKKKEIALLYGGMGAEHDISLLGAEYIKKVIDKKRFRLHPIFIDKSGEWYYGGDREKPVSVSLAPRGLAVRGEMLKIDAAIPVLHGDFGEDGRVEGLLDCVGIPYIGCGVCAGAVGSDKYLAKCVAKSLEIPVARDILLVRGEDVSFAQLRAETEIGYPMIVKPTNLGSSFGVEKIVSPQDFRSAVSRAFSHSDRVIIEEYIEDVREIECAYFSAGGEVILPPPGEVRVRGVYDSHEKYSEESHAVCIVRAKLDPDMVELVREYTTLLAVALGVSGLSRFDFFYSAGTLIFNEVNTFPGFTEASLYAAMMDGAGVSPRELFSRLISGVLP